MRLAAACVSVVAVLTCSPGMFVLLCSLVLECILLGAAGLRVKFWNASRCCERHNK